MSVSIIVMMMAMMVFGITVMPSIVMVITVPVVNDHARLRCCNRNSGRGADRTSEQGAIASADRGTDRRARAAADRSTEYGAAVHLMEPVRGIGRDCEARQHAQGQYG